MGAPHKGRWETPPQGEMGDPQGRQETQVLHLDSDAPATPEGKGWVPWGMLLEGKEAWKGPAS